MISPWLWAVGALVVAFIELAAPGFYLIWIALGGAVTALAAWGLALSLPGELATFAAASVCCCGAGFFVYRRLGRAGPETTLNQRQLELVGARGVVAEPIMNGHGKIRLGDSVWLAEGPNLPAGAAVVVTAVRGTTAIIVAAA